MRTNTSTWMVAALVLGVLVLAVADNARPWRQWQLEFFEREQARVVDALATLRGQPDAEAAELQAELIAAEERAATQSADEVDLERQIGELEAKLAEAEREHDVVSQRLAMARYRASSETVPLEEELREIRMRVEGFHEEVDGRRLRLQDMQSDLREARERWQNHSAPIVALETRLEELERGAWWRRLPILGQFHPSVALHEVEPGAAEGPTVDRCATCHLGASRAGAEGENWPLVLRSHPRLDLFVGETSPHPYQQFGCAVCHGGEGRATSFERAGHPAAALTDNPIFPRGLFDASCARCHGDDTSIAGAPVPPTVTAGRRLVGLMGCRSCHHTPESESLELPKAGPSLGGLAAKTNPEWTFSWLAAPRNVQPTTWMPHFFDLTADDRERQIAEIRAILVYLWEKSGDLASGEPPAGDPAVGRELFEATGCAACHLATAESGRDDAYPSYQQLQGPNLSKIGDKVTASWLNTWLLDPAAYRHDTPMPNLRLDQGEAADLTAYLMTLRDPAWESQSLPPMPAAKRDELVLGHLLRTATVESSEARFEAMSRRELELDLYLGEQTIARYGCHGCHQIPGFEGQTFESFDLTNLGEARALRFLDAGHPGLTADGSPGLPRPVPDFGTSRQESEALVTTLLAWQGSSDDRRNAAHSRLAAGEALIERYGCRGCHRLEEGGDGGSFGPHLTKLGAKVRPSWLFEYLRDPGATPLRPWLTARMPTFHWTDDQREVLVRWFVERADAGLFTSEPPTPRRQDLAVGAALFRTLQCERCHLGAESPIPVTQFAPDYQLARHRLRPDWVAEWILDPHRWDPNVRMTANFVSGSGNEPDASFIAAGLGTPLFRSERDRLLRVFDDQADIEAYFSDPHQVAAALRDHLWSLKE